MIHTRNKTLLIALSVIVLLSVHSYSSAMKPVNLTKTAIIPKPAFVVSAQGAFIINPQTNIYVYRGSDELKQIGQELASRLNGSTGYKIKVIATDKRPASGNIYLALNVNTDPQLGEEGYKLIITPQLITVTANKPAGLYWGIQTFRQILPADAEKVTVQKEAWIVPAGTITDYPVYSYRGAMLDVARHFFSVEDVKRVVDLLSQYKMNNLHLHLSDDQGWRIEIKSWPELTRTGGSTEVGGGNGGYYTQEQYTSIVQYAKSHYITIIPEIDMPGHTNAALASYADLNCNGKATELYTGIEVGFSSFCTNKEITYKFIDDVVKELAAITPGPYIHIGGDESHATKKEDYIPFINKVQDIVNLHGKRAIGWDDIAAASLKSNTVAQHWANIENAKMAIGQGAKLIMSPAKKAYMDMQYDEKTKLGLHWAAYVEVDSAYEWDPVSLVPGSVKENFLGIEAALWSETLTNIKEIEYMVFPRLPGYAEIGWTPVAQRDWKEYKMRLAKHAERFKVLDINYYLSPKIQWGDVKN